MGAAVRVFLGALIGERGGFMKHLSVFFSGHPVVFRTISAAIIVLGLTATPSKAQHPMGHVGGGAGGHMGGGAAGHASAPPVAHAPASRPAPRPQPAPVARLPVPAPPARPTPVRPTAIQTLPPPGFILQPHRPFYRPAPIFVPVLIFPPGFGFFGFPYAGFWPGWGWGYTPDVWGGCGYSLNWNAACNGVPQYDYSTVFSPYSLAPGNLPQQTEIQNSPIYAGGEEGTQSAQLFLKDGTVYNVTDYWVDRGALHFKTAEENFTKVVEHTIGFDQLDLQKTIDVNTQRGYRFVLRNAPLEEYLKNQFPPASPAEPANPPGTIEPQ